jgi:hypothetical protein
VSDAATWRAAGDVAAQFERHEKSLFVVAAKPRMGTCCRLKEKRVSKGEALSTNSRDDA